MLPARKTGSTVAPTLCRSSMKNCLHHSLRWWLGAVIRTRDQHKPLTTAVLNNQSELVLTCQNIFHLFEPVLEATRVKSRCCHICDQIMSLYRGSRVPVVKEDIDIEPTLNQCPHQSTTSAWFTVVEMKYYWFPDLFFWFSGSWYGFLRAEANVIRGKVDRASSFWLPRYANQCLIDWLKNPNLHNLIFKTFFDSNNIVLTKSIADIWESDSMAKTTFVMPSTLSCIK